MKLQKKYEEVEAGILRDSQKELWFSKKASANLLNGRASATLGTLLVNFESPNVTAKKIADLLSYHGKSESNETRSVAPSEIATQLSKVSITRREIFISEHLLHELARYYAKNLVPLTLNGLLESVDNLYSRERIENLVDSKSDPEDMIDSLVNAEKRVTKKLSDNIIRLVKSEKQLQDLNAELFRNLKYLSKLQQAQAELFNSIETEMSEGLKGILDLPSENDKLEANEVFIAVNQILHKESEMRRGDGTDKAPNGLVNFREKRIQQYSDAIVKIFHEMKTRHLT